MKVRKNKTLQKIKNNHQKLFGIESDLTSTNTQLLKPSTIHSIQNQSQNQSQTHIKQHHNTTLFKSQNICINKQNLNKLRNYFKSSKNIPKILKSWGFNHKGQISQIQFQNICKNNLKINSIILNNCNKNITIQQFLKLIYDFNDEGIWKQKPMNKIQIQNINNQNYSFKNNVVSINNIVTKINRWIAHKKKQKQYKYNNNIINDMMNEANLNINQKYILQQLKILSNENLKQAIENNNHLDNQIEDPILRKVRILNKNSNTIFLKNTVQQPISDYILNNINLNEKYCNTKRLCWQTKISQYHPQAMRNINQRKTRFIENSPYQKTILWDPIQQSTKTYNYQCKLNKIKTNRQKQKQNIHFNNLKMQSIYANKLNKICKSKQQYQSNNFYNNIFQ